MKGIRLPLFAELMLEEGVLLRPNGLWYISIAHNNFEIEETLRAIDRMFVNLRFQGKDIR
jgi:glutamate-1-semialdehyde 2,1-aminomutase